VKPGTRIPHPRTKSRADTVVELKLKIGAEQNSATGGIGHGEARWLCQAMHPQPMVAANVCCDLSYCSVCAMSTIAQESLLEMLWE
jgi:hypothetical protein